MFVVLLLWSTHTHTLQVRCLGALLQANTIEQARVKKGNMLHQASAVQISVYGHKPSPTTEWYTADSWCLLSAVPAGQ